ncbi:unnamed protein product [Lactuca saligna]|uniref:Uncharacterized protein n=1 Tax=Lactuca saligna TaxID=75948 RepID=A0AA35YH85_LACSI|nr:unnamed protein product [Lactuca saligna]
MNELKINFKNKFISNTFINQSLIDEYYVTDSNGVTECDIEITGIDPTSYPAHLVTPTPLTENIIAFPISNGVFHTVHEQLKHFPDCNASVNKSKSDIDVSSSSITDHNLSDAESSCDSMTNKRTQSSLGGSYKSKCAKSRYAHQEELWQCIEESIHVKFDEESFTDEKVAHSSSIFHELLSCPYGEVYHPEEEAIIPDPIVLDPSSVNQGTVVSTTTHLSDTDETLEAEGSPATDVPLSNNTSVSNPLASVSASEHRDHPADQIIGNLHDGVQISNNFCIVIPAPNSPSLPIYIKATNVVFNPDIPDVHRGLGLDDFVNFLASCRLRYTISEVPSEFFPEQICDFYYSASVNNDNNVTSGTVGRGRHSVFITADLFSAALRLPIFEPFSELPSIERYRCLFDQLGYDHSKAGARSNLILRQCMTPGWKFFTGALCKCVGHKSHSGDQLSAFEQQVVCSLLLNKRLDYGAFFFDQLVQLLRTNV